MKKIISALLIAFSLSGAFAGAQQLKPQTAPSAIHGETPSMETLLSLRTIRPA